MDLAEARKLGELALGEVGLEGMADRFPDQLSGGEQQRVAIARGLVGPRMLLLADEPTGALDEATSDNILRIIRQRCDAGAAALLVTHEPAYAAWADRVVRLRDGRVESISERASVESLVETGP
jgi:putative ABC transport system ATP-binding protein